jgi:hypothetical protein
MERRYTELSPGCPNADRVFEIDMVPDTIFREKRNLLWREGPEK